MGAGLFVTRRTPLVTVFDGPEHDPELLVLSVAVEIFATKHKYRRNYVHFL